MSDHPYDVVIVGAGPTGLTLANLLGQSGVATLLVERNPETVREPRAVSIDDETLRTMQGAGLVDAVLADIAQDYGLHYYGADGRVFAKVEPSTREYGYPRRNAFAQVLFEATLRKGLARFPQVETLFETTAESVEQDADGVALVLRGADGDARRVHARYCVGSDGGRSLLRGIVGAKLEGSTFEERWLIVDLGATVERLRQTRVICDPARPVICLPGPKGVRRYEFMLQPGEDAELFASETHVRKLLAAYGPDGEAPIVRRIVYTFHARIADRWRDRRLLLGGDAAHLTPPFAGQGMNSGVRDAANLAWKLAAVLKGQLGDRLLDTYRQERAPHAKALIDFALNIGRVMTPSSPLQAKVVQGAFRMSRLAPPVHDYFAQYKYKPKPFYRSGFMQSSDALRVVGRMLPQPFVETPERERVRLDDLLGPGFALLAIGLDAQTHLARSLSEDFGLPVERRVALTPFRYNVAGGEIAGVARARLYDDALARFAPEGRERLLLIRPDRYVAAAVDCSSTDGVAALARTMRALAASTFDPSARAA